MRSMTHHSSCITTGSTINIVALRGEITSLDIRIERQLRTLAPGQALTDDLVLRLADYCQGARYLAKNDTQRTHRWKRRPASSLITATQFLGTTGDAA